jgi:hypothetical protein
MPALQVAGQVRKELGQPLGAASLSGGRLRLPTPRPCGLLPWGPPDPLDAVLVVRPELWISAVVSSA